MYGTDYNAQLARELDCDLSGDGSIAVDDHDHTSIESVYAVSDVTHGAQSDAGCNRRWSES